MISINLDKQNNRIMIKFIGQVTSEESSVNAKRFFEAVNDLDENFTIISDFSLWEVQSEEQLRMLLNLHMKVNELHKVGKVIRVVGKSKPLLVHLLQLDKKHQLTNIHYVPTINQAMQFDS
jgi:hypothetical protein